MQALARYEPRRFVYTGTSEIYGDHGSGLVTEELETDTEVSLWTDDYSNVFRLLKHR